MKFSKELLKGSTQQLILAVLQGNDLYGYQIIKEIRQRSDDALELGEGSVYPMLHHLEEKKLVKGYWRTESKRERKYYQITAKGKIVLSNSLREWKFFAESLNKVFQSP